MTRRIVRRPNFNITLEVTNPEFLSTPRVDQRNWILKKALKEISDDLDNADANVGAMIPGVEPTTKKEDLKNDFIDAERIMESWQVPVMERMAELVCFEGANILEIGYGRGVASRFVQKHKPSTHTIVECNPIICGDCESWVEETGITNVKLLEGMWQDVIGGLGEFDGILFHTYPIDDEDFAENVSGASTFAEHFFKPAYGLLKSGGCLTYLTLESDSIGRNHQRALFDNFNGINMSKMTGLDVPSDSKDALWIPSLVLVQAIK